MGLCLSRVQENKLTNRKKRPIGRPGLYQARMVVVKVGQDSTFMLPKLFNLNLPPPWCNFHFLVVTARFTENV